jgi:N-acyl-phosphatidylethanolamine-hydrolysing phospholipase D
MSTTLSACAPPPNPWRPPENPVVSSLYAPHRKDGAFFNPWAPFSWRVSNLLRWYLGTNAFDKSRPFHIPVVANDGASLAGLEHSATVTWVGHATFAVHDEADVFLTDPNFGERALIPSRKVPPGVPIGSIPPDSFAVISHSHYDHLDAYTVDTLPASVTWYVPLGMGEWFRERGRIATELDWWQSAQRGRWTITCLPSQHWSRRFGASTNESLWCSWLIDSGRRKYYFAGDSGYFHGFAEVGRKFSDIDVAMLPIGAYEPRWLMRYQHMNPTEAFQAFKDLKARFLLPMHWGTFDLTDEPLDEPPKALARAVKEAQGDESRVHVMAIGEIWHVPGPNSADHF